MPRITKPLVVDTSLAQPAPVAAQQLPPVNLDQPDAVACIRCGAPSRAVDSESSAQQVAQKCPGCGLRFDDEMQQRRANQARVQTIDAAERERREQTAKARALDPNLGTTVVDAFGKVIVDIQTQRDAAAAEVEASKERFEKACAVVFANEDAESLGERDKAHAEMDAAPMMLAQWDSALARAQALLPLAEESDALVAAGPSAQAFQVELANRMATARGHFAAAFAEVSGAFEAQRNHASVMRAASNKRKELNEQLTSIKRSLSLVAKLPHGFGRFASHEDVSFAAVQVVVEVLNASGIPPALVDDIRARVRWQ